MDPDPPPPEGDRPPETPPAASETNGEARPVRRPDAGDETFPVVGIGASAGGLRAFQEFFSALPPQPDMAFVLVQHLSPDHESALAELIQSRTQLSVNQVTDHPAVEANCVYVIPPGKHLEMQGGHLQLVEIKRERGKPTAVDHFFRSIAREVGDRAVAVVLSGTGSDGALGLKAVKERAGLTLAQDPEDADYDGMPQSAIATGLVDLTGTPAELARKLVQVRRAADVVPIPEADEPIPQSDEQALRSIFGHLRRRTGHDFTHYKRSTILRRLARRTHVTGVDSLSAYAGVLRTTPDETDALLRDFLISVTQFFRDPEAFETLERDVIPTLFEGAGGQVRVWVPGCATGEEAYSIAMLLCEHADMLESRPDIQVFATDIDEEALAQARQGVYPDAAAADLSPVRLRRFFQSVAGGISVKSELRELVLFAPHNLLTDPPFSRLDLVSCRNVLIYFNREIQARAFASFHYALRPDGYLFLGSSEAPAVVTNGFAEVDARGRVFRRRDVPVSTRSFPLQAASEGSRERRTAAASEGGGGEPTSGLLDRYQAWTLERYAPPRLLVDERYDLTHVFGRAGDYLRDREGPVTQNAVDKVLRAFRIDLRTALYRAFSKGESVDTPFRRVEVGEEVRYVRLHVGPVGGAARADGLAEVVFIELDPASVEALEVAAPVGDSAEGVVAARLEEELQTTRARLQAIIEEQETSNEELKASNEELQSMNEELQSTTEELETSREELQSMNEELSTVNQELKSKVEELTRSNSDLQNLMASMEVATLFLDRSLRLERFTPRAADLFHVIASDLGRPFSHVAHKIDHEDLEGLARNVLETLQPAEQTVAGHEGGSYLLRALPYRTLDDRIDGVVLTLVDVTDLEAARAEVARRAEQQALVARLGESALRGAPLPALFDEAVAGVRAVLGADACKVLRHEAEAGRLRLVAGVGWDDGLVGTATVPDATDSQAGYTLISDGTVLVDDLATEARFTAPPLLTGHDMQSGMSVVIRGGAGGTPFGVLGVHCRDCRTYTETDGRFLQSVANVLADAIAAGRHRDTIREQLAEIEAVYETAPVGLAFMDESLRYRRINRRLAEINGRPIEDHIGRSTRDVIPALADTVEPVLHQVRATGEPVEDVEVRGAVPSAPDDERVWLCSYVPSYDARENLRGVSIVVRDITDRKRVEEALASTAARLDRALTSGRVNLWTITFADGDPEEGSVWLDDQAAEAFGVEVGTPLREVLGRIHSADRPDVEAVLERAVDPADDEVRYTVDFRFLMPDETYRWLRADGQAAFDESAPVRLDGVLVNIDAIKQAQDQIHRQLVEVESYFDAIPVGVAIFDRDGRYVRVNDRLGEIIGEAPDDLIGRAAKDVLPDLAPFNEPYLRRVLSTGVPVLNVEMQLPRPGDAGGPDRDWLVSFYPLRDEGEVAGVSVVVQDVTAIRRAERGLEALTAELEDRVNERTEQVRRLAADLTEAEQRERQRVAELLHDDLQQLLYALQVRLQIVQQASDRGDTGEARDALGQSSSLLDDAIRCTRALTVDLSPPVLSGEGLERVFEWLAHRMDEAYGLRVSVGGEVDTDVDKSVQVLLYQVVRELLFNVVKHAGTGEAGVRVRRLGADVEVVVEDEGSGFSAPADGAAGGFGLLGVRERIRAVGGRVRIETAPGEGARVEIVCPAVP